ncbi:hypothetical protein N7468_010423 [Penicillium chermesinum]|uniref:Cell wall protein n=1 Tax=Penicillium chermesinum TaxID=63820 RepID=A0A9W9TDC1_9EURO|nr:uncharacterized protein N7468_010423 [Penicillium chermesinum]KAJ5217415.1 hypothetical protein N7468_010423 [Penicillium chermesinum]KAJ6170973.1 hypothetical protein N7470_000040 [Penicillium chermesinum]
MKFFLFAVTLALSGLSAARTDLSGCVSSLTVNQWDEASLIWYVPGSGEICDFPDCGGGRAPPKTDQPGCPEYSGTATLTPSYLPGYGPSGKMRATAATASATTSEISSTSDATSATASSSASSSTPTANTVTPAPTTSPTVLSTTVLSTTVLSTTVSSTTSSSAGNSTVSTPASTATNNVASGLEAPGALAMIAMAIGALI